MEYRELGRTGWKVSGVSVGCWAIGGTWGMVDDRESMAALRRAVELGVNFFDTADVYGDGKSERLLAKLYKEVMEEIHIATKAGRRLNPHVSEGYNREGQAFDRGETFAGVDFETGLQAVEELKRICPPGMTMAQFTLRWILMSEDVSSAIPGGKRPSQVEDNVTAADFSPLSFEAMEKVREIYECYIKPQVHQQW